MIPRIYGWVHSVALFHLGSINIRLDSSLPGQLTPNILYVLVENFNLMPTFTLDEDLKAIP